MGLWARQTGKDYTCAAEAVIDSINTPNNHWLIIACGERQAIESLQHAKHWAQFVGANFSSSKTEIRFNNGSRITALPAKPETIRGYSANLILTEFAFHDQPEQIWRAVFPILTNPLKAGPRKLRIISTPNGHSNLFHKLWITDAPTPNLNPNLSPTAPSALNSPVFLTREVLILPNSPTPAQLEHLTPRIHRARRVCLDYTGAGIGLGDLLVQAHGEFVRSGGARLLPSSSHGKIELCTFTAPLKHELFSHLRSAFERQLIAIPSSTAIREDLHSIQRVVTANGQIHYRAAHTADGHSDRATALALALRAAESTPQLAAPSSVGRRNSFLASRR